MITLDASVVIAHLAATDPHHGRATSLLDQHAGEDLLVHELNLAEVLVGAVRVGRGDELLRDLEAIGVRVPDRTEGEALALAGIRVETGLTLPDCCALLTAVRSGTALATFDDRLSTAARGRRVEVLGS